MPVFLFKFAFEIRFSVVQLFFIYYAVFINASKMRGDSGEHEIHIRNIIFRPSLKATINIVSFK